MTENKMTFEQIKKHALKITKKAGDTRPVLQLIQLKDNYINATDRHRILRVKHKHDNNIMYNPKTDEKIENSNMDYSYPDINRVIPIQDENTNVIEFSEDEIDTILNTLKFYKKIKVKTVKFDLVLDNKELIYTLNFDKKSTDKHANIAQKLDLTYKLKSVINNKEIETILLNTEYLINAFEFIKDFNKSNQNQHINVYQIEIDHKHKPINITNKYTDFNYIICPLRQN